MVITWPSGPRSIDGKREVHDVRAEGLRDAGRRAVGCALRSRRRQ
jgi:hypothetical protein